MQDYICKIANRSEMERKWDDEIAHAQKSRRNWEIWKEKALRQASGKKALPYYGIWKDRIICEATASLCADGVQNAEGLVDQTTAYLSAFRTIQAFQGKGYFSKLFRFMINDLKSRGYQAVTLGVEPHETENRAIYEHFGFSEYVKTAVELYPDGTTITVDYYRKRL